MEYRTSTSKRLQTLGYIIEIAHFFFGGVALFLCILSGRIPNLLTGGTLYNTSGVSFSTILLGLACCATFILTGVLIQTLLTAIADKLEYDYASCINQKLIAEELHKANQIASETPKSNISESSDDSSCL